MRQVERLDSSEEISGGKDVQEDEENIENKIVDHQARKRKFPLDEGRDSSEEISGGKDGQEDEENIENKIVDHPARKRKFPLDEGGDVSEAVNKKHAPALGRKKPSRQSKRTYNTWSNLEDELHKIFANCFKSLKTPSRKQVSSRLILCDASEELRKRGATLIVKKISAEINKVKRDNNME